MGTKLVQYATGDIGYSAMVNDLKEIFPWDEYPEYSGDGNKYTTFKVNCEGDKRVGLRVFRTAYYAPMISAFATNGSYSYVSNTNTNNTDANVAYAYGDGFIIACGGTGSLPASDDSSVQNTTSGVVRARDMLTGDTTYCSFSTNTNYLFFYTQNLMNGNAVSAPLTKNASVGAAISLHHPQHLYVADNVLLLTAIPDTITACLTTVMFNGTPYTRLGRILIPAVQSSS